LPPTGYNQQPASIRFAQGILMPFLSPYLTPIVLLIGSNVFMTAAW
jgi:hypothetical protein